VNYENLKNEKELRRFLLGEMPEDERLEFEESFIFDEDLFDNLRVAEDELIEDYVRGTLEVSDKNKFEANFLTTPKRRQRVEFTRQMLEKLKVENVAVAKVKKTISATENPSFFASIAAFFKQPGFALGTGFALVLLIFGGWFLLRNPNKPVEIVQNTPTPIPQISVTPTATPLENNNVAPINVAPNKISDSNNPRPKVEPTINKTPKIEKTPKPQTIGIIPTLALFTGGVRSDGKTNELNLTENTTAANLQLNLESNDYKIYRAEIVDQNGNVIYRSGKLSAKNKQINAFVPAKNLKRGDYIVKVYGKNAKNEDESAADYQFRVNQK
jgi:hypothetical protein